MYIFYSKKDIINKFNTYLEDYNNMKELCSIAGNDVDRVYRILNMIVKFVLKYHFNFIKNTNNIVDCYYNALSFSEKKIRFVQNNDVLNGSLEEQDLNGIRIPSKNFVNRLCEKNILEQQEIESMHNERMKHFRELQGFNEVGFTYIRPEMVHLNDYFNYYYTDCTGDVYTDYHQLYGDERYSNEEEDNPLFNDYYQNLDSIRNSNNIQVSKFGNLYHIDNGRHRLLYVLYHGWDEEVPCMVTKRIENREFNIITYKLKKFYHAKIYKNNILDDNPNIVICLDGKLYKIDGINELQDFYAFINNSDYLKKYYVRDFEIIDFGSARGILYRYKKDLIEQLSNNGMNLLNMNFSDLLKMYPKRNNQVLYEAFNQLKTSYLRSRIFDSERDLSKSLLDEYKYIISSLNRIEEKNNKIR